MPRGRSEAQGLCLHRAQCRDHWRRSRWRAQRTSRTAMESRAAAGLSLVIAWAIRMTAWQATDGKQALRRVESERLEGIMVGLLQTIPNCI